MINELSTLSTLPKSIIKSLFDNECDIIGHKVFETIINNENLCEVDIGIGTLILDISDNICYKFIPSQDLEDTLISVVNTNDDCLTKKIENVLSEKIINTYKDLF